MRKNNLFKFLALLLVGLFVNTLGFADEPKQTISPQDYWFYYAFESRLKIDKKNEGNAVAGHYMEKDRWIPFTISKVALQPRKPITKGFIKAFEAYLSILGTSKTTEELDHAYLGLQKLIKKNLFNKIKDWGYKSGPSLAEDWKKWLEYHRHEIHYSYQFNILIPETPAEKYWEFYSTHRTRSIQKDGFKMISGEMIDLHGFQPFIANEISVASYPHKTKVFISAVEHLVKGWNVYSGNWPLTLDENVKRNKEYLESIKEITEEINGYIREKREHLKEITGQDFETSEEYIDWLKQNQVTLEYSEGKNRLVPRSK